MARRLLRGELQVSDLATTREGIARSDLATTERGDSGTEIASGGASSE
ncbi:MAG: hypothetical protein FWG98_11505 [Candidatus Cloacimonetes bacterium]|nr:hypothetical protein [Candidatus Cloacimonadota bacterium]